MRPRLALAAVVFFTVLLAGCQPSGSRSSGMSGMVRSSGGSSTSATSSDPRLDQQGAPILPDPKMTPGDVLAVTKDDICVSGYSGKVRNVPSSVKKQVYAEYGIMHHAPHQYEVDHLISLELGGSNSIKNLWPESYLTQPWNAHVKDQLENRLHEMICSGQIDMPTAQHEIATDWIAAYKKYFKTDVPLSGGSPRGSGGGRSRASSVIPDASDNDGDADDAGNSTSTASASSSAPAGDTGQVWVNTRSGKYFHSGSRYYGHTKQGQYMTEAQAEQKGYTAAQGQ